MTVYRYARPTFHRCNGAGSPSGRRRVGLCAGSLGVLLGSALLGCGDSGKVSREDEPVEKGQQPGPPPIATAVEPKPKPAGAVGTAAGFLASAATPQQAQQAYEQWKQKYLKSCPGDVYMVDAGNDRVVSEGIAYGMLLSAYHNEQAIFDGLWQYYLNNLDGNGLMHWERFGCDGEEGDPPGNNAASDAELDAAMALIKASCQWPNNGRHDYAKDATELIVKIQRFESWRLVDGGQFIRPGDAFGGPRCVNYSYFAPGYYRVFAQYVPERAGFWNNAAETAYAMINLAADSQTGLVPNWGNADGSTPPEECTWYDNPHLYGWDAVRTPWRVATDHQWFGAPAAATYLKKLVGWVQSNGGIESIRAEHELDGTAAVSYRSNPATGGLALAGMAVDQATADDFLGYFVNNPDAGYYQESLRALYLLTASGLFVHSCEGVVYP